MPLEPGQILKDRYRIEGQIGEGGMGAVYRATDLTFDTTVAIKENLGLSPEAQRQFRREAELLHQLDHPRLPRVSNYLTIPGRGQYLVMDYIAGKDLNQILDERGRLSEAEALGLIDQVLDALAYLHSQDPQPVIHRDVKPGNIKVTAEGRVCLVDFGLAKVHSPHHSTTIGARGVTPGYAPPEQYGQATTDARSDIYAAGATLYTLLTGQRPPDALPLALGQARLAPPRTLNPGISPRVEAAVLQAMQIRPDHRFRSASAFRAALGGLHPRPAGRLPPAAPGSAPAHRMRQPRRRGRILPALAAALVVVTLVVALGGGLLFGGILDMGRVTGTPTPTASDEPDPTPAATQKPPEEPTATGAPAPTGEPQEEPTPTSTLPTEPPEEPTPSSTPTATVEAPEEPTSTSTPTATIEPPEEPTSTSTPATAPPTPGPPPRIAFVSNRDGSDDLWIMAAGGYDAEPLTNHPAADYGPAPNRSGQRFAFGSDRDGNWEIYRIDAGGGVTRLTDHPEFDHMPSYSPDGQRITFMSTRDGNLEIYAMDADGGNVTRLTDNPAVDALPAWGPGGGRIAFQSDRSGNDEIWLMNAGGSGLQKLTNHPAPDWGPAWSPDGRRIAFASERDGNWEIYAVNVDGSGLQRLTDHVALDQDPAWSPDGTQIAFTSQRDGNPEIYVMNTDGSGVVRLTKHGGKDEAAAWVPQGGPPRFRATLAVAIFGVPAYDMVTPLTPAGTSATSPDTNQAGQSQSAGRR